MIYIASDLVLDDLDGDNRANAPLVGYRSLIAFSNVAADEEADGFPVTNLANPATSELWQGTTTGAQYITVNLDAEDVVDYFGLARHNLGTTGAVIQLQGSDDAVTWTDVGEELSPDDDTALMHRFALATYQYWRLSITPGSAPPAIGVFYMGKLLVMQRNLWGGHTPITMSYDGVTTIGISESGQYLGAVSRRANPSTSASFKNLTATWVRANLAPFLREAVGTGTNRLPRPFFFAWRPTSYPTEVGYVWIPAGAAPKLTNQSGVPRMDAEFQLQGVL
jgi:hypothetical protein